MFRKLKEKIVENSPQRLQFSQLVGDNTKLSNPPAPEENFFSISEDDANTSSSNMESGYTSVPLVSPQENRPRRNSNSSLASDVSFLPRYESSLNMYQLQSDLDVSASELEDNVSTSSQVGRLSKEQIYSAFQKSQMQYHKYRGRYTDLAKHYKDLERENVKMKSVLVETQDKAIRRVRELKEQCSLEQKAKAHLESALRDELDERQLKIDSLETKIKILQSGNTIDLEGEPDTFVNETNGNAKNSLSQKTAEDIENLRKYLTEARLEIEKLNEKLQEVKANNIILNSKEQDYKSKIAKLDKDIANFSEREKENNLKLAQSKMELHNELIAKEAEMNNLKKDNEVLRQSLEAFETTNIKNLQAQNKKLIEKIESLNEKYTNYESELLKIEQYKIEIKNFKDTVSEMKKKNEELSSQLVSREEFEEKHLTLVAETQKLQDTIQTLKEENDKLVSDISSQKEEYEKQISNLREEAKKGLLSLEEKMREKLAEEYTVKQEELEALYQQRMDSLTSNELDSKKSLMKLIESEQMVKQLTVNVRALQSEIEAKQSKYNMLEKGHLELISEGGDIRNELSSLEKELASLKSEMKDKDAHISNLQSQMSSLEGELTSTKHGNESLHRDYETVQEERLGLIEDNASLKEQIRLAEEKLRCIESENNENQLLMLKIKTLTEDNQKLLDTCELERKQHDELIKENTKFKGYEEQIQGLENQIIEKQEQLSSSEEEARNAEEERHKLKSEISNLHGTIKGLEKDLVVLKNKEETWNITSNEYALLQVKIQKLEEDKVEQKSLFESEKSQYVEEISNYKNSIENLQKSHSSQKEQHHKLEIELESIQSQLDEIKASAAEKIKHMRTEKDEMAKENENLQLSLDETRAKLSDYQNNSTDQQKNYESKIDSLSKENKKAKAIIKKDKEQLETLNKDLKQKADELQKVTSEFTEVQSLCMKHETQLKELQNLIHVKETENTVQIKKEKEYQNELIHKVQELERKISEQNSTCENSEQKLLTFENEKEQLCKRIEQLKEFEALYLNMSADNSSLREETSKLQSNIAELVSHRSELTDKIESLNIDLKQLQDDKTAYEGEKNILLEMREKYITLKQEVVKLEQEISRIEVIEEEKLKLKEDLTSLVKDHNAVMERNKSLKKQLEKAGVVEIELKNALEKVDDLTNEISTLHAEKSSLLAENTNIETNKFQELSTENEMLKEGATKLKEEISQLKLNYSHISTDNKHIIEENNALLQELESTKLKLEIIEENTSQTAALNEELLSKNMELENKYLDVKNELESDKNNRQEESRVNSLSENSDELLKIQQDFYEMKQTCDNLFIENRNLKADLNKLEERCDVVENSKKQYESQISELEKQYNELMHEKQLLQDEIQELKISPINLQNSCNKNERLDSLEIMKKEKELSSEMSHNDKCKEEIEALREKVTKYKSLDLTNKSSIEFYENELQKMKNKNDKLNRKLDETLVTLNHCAELSHSTEIEYLRNVLYNYMLGKEGLVLARVIAAVCKFDAQQTETVLQKEQQKQSLLGSLGIL